MRLPINAGFIFLRLCCKEKVFFAKGFDFITFVALLGREQFLKEDR